MTASPSEQQPGGVRRGLGQLLWSCVDMLGAKVVTLLTFLVLASLLPPKDFGVAALATSIIGAMAATIDASFGSCLMQRQNIDDRYFDTCFTLILATAGALCVVFLGAGAAAAALLKEPDYLWIFAALAPAIAFHSLTVACQARLVRTHRLEVVARARITAVLASAAGAVAMAVLNPSVWVLVVQQLVNTGVFALVILFWSGWRARIAFRRDHAADIVAFSRYFWVWGGVSALDKNLDVWIVTAWLGPTATGLFSTAQRLTLMAYEITTGPVVRLALPIYARLQDAPDLLRERYLALASAAALVMFPAFVGLALAGPALVPLLLGPEWTAAGEILPLLAVATWLYASNMYDFQLLTALNRPDKVLYLNVASLVLLAAALAGGLPFGLAGVAAGFVLRNLVMKALLLREARRILSIGVLDYARSMRMAALCTAAMAVGFQVPHWLGGAAGGWPDVLAHIGSAILFYAACAALLHRQAVADVRKAFTAEQFAK